MVHPSKRSLEAYRQHLAEVNELMAQYKNLIESDEEKAVAQKIDNSWKQVVSKAEALLQARDAVQETQEQAWDMVHEADDILDYKLQPTFVPGSPDMLEKEKTVREVEVSIWEAISATNYYVHRTFDKPKREYPIQINDVKEFWGTYKRLQLIPSEKLHAVAFEATWKKAVDLMNKLYIDVEKLTEAQSVFWEDVHQAKSIIDYEIKARIATRISK